MEDRVVLQPNKHQMYLAALEEEHQDTVTAALEEAVAVDIVEEVGQSAVKEEVEADPLL
jgi:hypothetical protein